MLSGSYELRKGRREEGRQRRRQVVRFPTRAVESLEPAVESLEPVQQLALERHACMLHTQNPRGGCTPNSFSNAARDVDARDVCCGANAAAEANKRERAAAVFMVAVQ